jgi:SAM-dependent methyltransferase
VSALATNPDLAGARRAEAEAWLAAAPIKTLLRRRAPGRPWPRLVMYRTGAGTPEFWEKTWLVSPPCRMRGYTLPRWYQPVFERWLKRDGLIVEAGCGNGNLLRMMTNHWPDTRIEGLDFAENAVAENRRIHPEGRYRVGDVRDLPYQTGELAGYLSMGVVEHFDDAERARILREAARALRPGGVAVITVPHLSPARRFRTLIGGFDPEPPGPTPGFYQFFFTTREITRQVEAAGLRVVAIDGYDCKRGLSDACGPITARLLDRLERRGRRWARLIEQPPRVFRRLCPHMVMVVAVKD